MASAAIGYAVTAVTCFGLGWGMRACREAGVKNKQRRELLVTAVVASALETGRLGAMERGATPLVGRVGERS